MARTKRDERLHQRMLAAHEELQRLHGASSGVGDDADETVDADPADRCVGDVYEPADAEAVGSSSGSKAVEAEVIKPSRTAGREDTPPRKRNRTGAVKARKKRERRRNERLAAIGSDGACGADGK